MGHYSIMITSPSNAMTYSKPCTHSTCWQYQASQQGYGTSTDPVQSVQSASGTTTAKSSIETSYIFRGPAKEYVRPFPMPPAAVGHSNGTWDNSRW